MVIGITLSGEKRFLGFVETDTENAKVLAPFLRSLVDRGLDASHGLLVILAGATAGACDRRSRKCSATARWCTGASGTSARMW